MAVWTEHTNAAGRKYWYHTQEKRSVWDKPDELRTPRERAMAATPWKEYAAGERRYYVHAETKETTWKVPKELQDIFDTMPDEPAAAAAATPAAAAAAAAASPAAGTPLSGGVTPAAAAAASPAQVAAGHSSPGGAARPVYSGPPPGFAAPAAGSPNGALAGSPPSASLPARPAVDAAAPVPSAPLPASLPQRVVPVGPASSAPFAPGAFGGPGGGEAAFVSLLKGKGIDASWTWESAMREIITEPLYKALKSMSERKAAFAKYVAELQREENERREAQVKELEPGVRELLENMQQLKPFFSIEATNQILADEPKWKQLREVGEEKARELWETVKKEWKEKETAAQRELRHRNMDMLMSLLLTFEADVFTRWKDAQRTVLESDEWASDAHLSTMDAADMIIVFDEHMRALEKEKETEAAAALKKRRRDERRRREQYKQRLQELVADGTLTARTPWPTIYKLVKHDADFAELAAQPGSSPLDLYFDVVDELESRLHARTKHVERLLESAGNEAAQIDEKTEFEDFKLRLKKASEQDGEGAEVLKDEKELRLVFDELVERAVRAQAEQRRRAERRLRHLTEDLRYALRKVSALPVEDDAALERPWEEWRPKLAALELKEWSEMQRLDIEEDKVDESRKSAWERFVRRQKEKNEERRAKEGSPHLSSSSRKRRDAAADEEDDKSRHRSSKHARSSRDARDARPASGRREEEERRRERPTEGEESARKRARHEEEDSEKEEGEV